LWLPKAPSPPEADPRAAQLERRLDALAAGIDREDETLWKAIRAEREALASAQGDKPKADFEARISALEFDARRHGFQVPGDRPQPAPDEQKIDQSKPAVKAHGYVRASTLNELFSNLPPDKANPDERKPAVGAQGHAPPSTLKELLSSPPQSCVSPTLASLRTAAAETDPARRKVLCAEQAGRLRQVAAALAARGATEEARWARIAATLVDAGDVDDAIALVEAR
jgi:hypothetical protein